MSNSILPAIEAIIESDSVDATVEAALSSAGTYGVKVNLRGVGIKGFYADSDIEDQDEAQKAVVTEVRDWFAQYA